MIDTILLGLLNFSSLAVSDSYVYIGFILAGIAMLLVVNAFVRIAYFAHKKYKQALDEAEEWVEEQKQPKTERVV
jgi:transposase